MAVPCDPVSWKEGEPEIAARSFVRGMRFRKQERGMHDRNLQDFERAGGPHVPGIKKAMDGEPALDGEICRGASANETRAWTETHCRSVHREPGRVHGADGSFLARASSVKPCAVLILCAILCLPALPLAAAGDGAAGGTITFYQENDLYAGTDRDYTNGIKLSWVSPDLEQYRDDPRLPKWSHALIDAMPFSEGEGFLRTVSLSVGQNIYTPDGIESHIPSPDDRPYAGISYLALGFQSRNKRVMNSWEYTLGIIGPHSYAEDVQKAVHHLTHSDFPNGWEHQLRDEVILNVFYDRKWRFAGENGSRNPSYDLIPHAGCSVGNALTAVNAGIQLRYGWNLPNDFGTLPIRPGSDTNAPLDRDDPRLQGGSRGFSIHTFVSADVYAKLWDITLDGNFFRSGGPSVDKEPFVAQYALGLGMIVGRFKITYAYVTGSREYETQKDRQTYGTITVSYTFD